MLKNFKILDCYGNEVHHSPEAINDFVAYMENNLIFLVFLKKNVNKQTRALGVVQLNPEAFHFLMLNEWSAWS